MALTKVARDALPASDFAVPGKRALPFHDLSHCRMAWSMVDKTKGLSADERAQARRRILSKARDLGIDTSEWTKIAASALEAEAYFDDETELGQHALPLSMRFEAAALNLPDDADHPNRMPFSGILTRIDQASDASPNGAGGKKVVISKRAAEAATGSLLTMGVNLTADLTGHDPKNKVGVITAASVDGDAIRISGHIYKGDFPKEAATIKAQKANLGFSFEADSIFVADLTADPLEITSCKFTGASILLKEKAAYRSTSLAASAAESQDTEMTPDEMKALFTSTLDAQLKPLVERLDKVEAASKVAVEKLEASAVVRDAVEPHAKRLEDAADAMEGAKIGLHADRGHVTHLRKMASDMRADAAGGKMPYACSFNGGMYAASNAGAEAAAAAKAEGESKAALESTLKAAIEAGTKPLLDKIAAQETKLADLKAAAFANSNAPERKTLSPQIMSLLKKGGADLGESGNDKIPLTKFNEILTAAGVTDPQRRIAAKLQASAIIAD